MLKTLFHLFGAVQFFYGCYYDYVYVKMPLSYITPYGGKFKYLTYLDAMIQTTYFTLALINDIVGTNEPSPSQKPLIRRVKDTVFSSLAFPLALFVGVSFWGIYAVDRELILPRSMDEFFPTWLNHVMHSNIVVFILIELLTSFRMYPKRKVGLSILSFFMICYLVWVHVIYYNTGFWVYPILHVLNWPLRIGFYLFCLAFASCGYILGERVNRAVWSSEVEKTVRSGKKKAK
nr:androgen-induced gene 1 protein [Helicoverpa armigera]